MPITLYPHCKLNIGLRVLRKRPDGYHDIESIFFPVYALHDVLTLERAETFSFEQDGIVVDCAPEDNLIVRCYRRMRTLYPAIGDVRIRFSKHIPFGAGLGGGSSDAAHTAIALDRLFDLRLSREQLAEAVRPLGADCPFFVYDSPCYVEGIGERLTPITLNLSGLRLFLYKPDCGVSTREAYAGIALHPEAEHALRDALHAQTPLADLRPLLINDFEQTVFPLHPEIGLIKEQLLAAGALYASMSGSGSTVFALFAQDASPDLSHLAAPCLLDTILP